MHSPLRILFFLFTLHTALQAADYTFHGRPYALKTNSYGSYYEPLPYATCQTPTYTAQYDGLPRPSNYSSTTTHLDNHWSGIAADALRKSVEYEGAVRKLSVEYDGLSRALDTLSGGRGLIRGYDRYRDVGGDPYAGNTAYGVTYSSVADVFGAVDRNVLHERFARATENLATVARDAHAYQGDLTDQEGSRQERLAEILARGEVAERASKAVEAIIRSAEPQARARIQTERKSEGVSPRLSISPLLTQFCVACHSGDAAKKGLHLDGSQRLTDDQAYRATLAVQLAHGLAGPAAKKIVRGPMPPKSSDQPKPADIPALLAEIGRLTQ